MNFAAIAGIVMTLFSKKDEIAAIIKAIMKLWPDIAPVLGQITDQAPAQSAYTVTWLQESLNKLVGSSLKADGSYGEATRAAVKKFQEAHGLTADGWAGIETQTAIANALK